MLYLAIVYRLHLSVLQRPNPHNIKVAERRRKFLHMYGLMWVYTHHSTCLTWSEDMSADVCTTENIHIHLLIRRLSPSVYMDVEGISLYSGMFPSSGSPLEVAESRESHPRAYTHMAWKGFCASAFNNCYIFYPWRGHAWYMKVQMNLISLTVRNLRSAKSHSYLNPFNGQVDQGQQCWEGLEISLIACSSSLPASLPNELKRSL